MAGKTKSMSQIKQLLLLKKQNVSNRKAATQVGMDKETVNNYVRKAKADPLGIDGLKKNTTAADAILDRIVHTAVRFDLKGESMRKKKSTKKSDVTEK